MTVRWKQWELVFTEEDGSQLSRYAVIRRFQRIPEGTDIPKRRFHDLRHTCATLLLAQGEPLRRPLKGGPRDAWPHPI